ncbi:MAG: hypothetical protein H0T73_01370, partial [Ardenticatenales bacterium]|nr:hypothetical protein [Ardenticatenales bacterium]
MTSVIYVHGTGVREKVFNRSFEVVSEEILKRRPELKMVPCFWGAHGAALQQGGASLPGGGSRSLDIEEGGTEDAERTRWAILYQDPLYELRVLGVGASSASNKSLAKRLGALQPSPELELRLEQAELADHWQAAREHIQHTDDFQAALRTAPKQQTHLAAVVARALVAESLARQAAAEPGVLPLDSILRDELVLFFTAELEGGTRFLDDLKDSALDIVYRAATYYVQGRREDLTEQNVPGVGDALYYMARGAAIRRFVQRCIEEAESPVVVLAHSLGGIISV